MKRYVLTLLISVFMIISCISLVSAENETEIINTNESERIGEKVESDNKGLGNEVGYYVFDYHAKDELFVRSHIDYLKENIK